jgi:predicted nucleic acid-binding protein
MVLDTSGLLAAIDAAQNRHAGARQALEQSGGPYLMSPFVLAELDYLLATRVGRTEQRALLEEVERGVYRLEPFSASDIVRARRVLKRYADLDLGLADASNVVLAERHSTHDILTLDERHFRAVLGPGDRPFRVLPVDL